MATVQVLTMRCWKQHACASCGCVYQYLMERSAQGTAFATAEQAAAKRLIAECDVHPCPNCGLVQPDMATTFKFPAQIILFGFSLVACFAITGAGMTATGESTQQIAIMGAIGVGIIALSSLLIQIYNPNRKLAANRHQAGAEMKAGKLRLITPGAPDGWKRLPANFGIGHFVGVLLVAAGAVPFVLAVDKVKDNPIQQAPGISPTVVKAGDQVRLTMQKSENAFQSINGYWIGKSLVIAVNFKELGIPVQMESSCPTKTWDVEIRASNSRTDETVHPWVDVKIPNEPSLKGKTIKIRVQIHYSYPFVIDARTFDSISPKKPVIEDFAVQVADEKVFQHQSEWLKHSGTAFGSVAVGGFFLVALVYRYRSKALATEVFPLEGNA